MYIILYCIILHYIHYSPEMANFYFLLKCNCLWDKMKFTETLVRNEEQWSQLKHKKSFAEKTQKLTT